MINKVFNFFIICFFLLVGGNLSGQVIASDDFIATDEEVPVFIDVQNNDVDIAGGTLATYFLTSPLNGTVEVTDLDSIFYTPDDNFNGVDTFSYLVCNDAPTPDCDDGYVIVTVIPTPDYPVAVDDEASTLVGTSVFIDVQANDVNEDPEILITEIADPPAHGTALVASADSILYQPEAGFMGSDLLIYEVCKAGSGVYCDMAKVHIHVGPLNTAYPKAKDDYAEVVVGSTTDIYVLENDSDDDSDVLYISDLLLMGVEGEVTTNANKITYTAVDRGTDSIYYVACDGGIPEYCDTALLRVTVLNLIVPNSFSPNGDGIHDYLVIDGLFLYPDFNLKIFNRWGALVFEQSTNTDFMWDGSSNQQTSEGTLPSGTYFYVLKLSDNIVPLLGNITLLK